MQLSTVTNDMTRRLRNLPAFVWETERPVSVVYEMDENGESEEVNLDYLKSNIYGDWMLHDNDTQKALVCSYEHGWEILRIMGARKVGEARGVFSVFAPVTCVENWFCISETIQTGRLGDCCIIQASHEFMAKAEALIRWSQWEVRDIFGTLCYKGSHSLYLNVMKNERHVATSMLRENQEREWWNQIYPDKTILRTGWYRFVDSSFWLPCCITIHGELFELIKLSFEPRPQSPFLRRKPKDFSAEYRELL